MKHTLLFSYSFLFLLIFVACTKFDNDDLANKDLSRTQVVMGTFCTITVNKHKIEEGFRYLKELESILSSYSRDALVFRLNEQKKININLLLKDIINESKKYYKLTNGYFDITIGSITRKLYAFGEKEKIPNDTQIANASLGIDSVIVTDKSIVLAKDITIDLGGIGKGYAVDKLSEYYIESDVSRGKIALSGDIRCLDACKVEVQSPFEENETIAILKSKITNLSISTSGTYRRYIKSKKKHHLINPKSKSQGRDFVSVTIVSRANNTLCDVMATAISVMPKDRALKFVKSQNEFGYLLVTPSAKLISGNLEKFVDYEKRVSDKN